MNSNTHGAGPPAPAGCLCLPAIDPAVPAVLANTCQRDRWLARFARAAARCGVALPAGEFRTIEQVVAAQWNAFLASQFAPGTVDAMAGTPVIDVDDSALRIVVHAHSRLNAYQLKPVVEALEADTPGLGWFVEAVLTRASRHALQIYDMGMTSTMLEVLHGELEEFSDQAYARALLLQEGHEAADGPIPQERIDELRTHYGFWPSDLLADVGGHGHLLASWQTRGVSRPQVLSALAAGRWLRQQPQHPRAALVHAALALQRLLACDRERAFVWDGEVDETEPLGALCFLAWDSPQLLFEAVQHFEENQYQGGMAVEAFARRTLPFSQADDRQLQTLARHTRTYLQAWARLAQLLAHFPLWEDSDEA